MKRFLLMMTVMMCGAITASAQTGFEKKMLVAEGDTLLYRELAPLSTFSKSKVPLVLFLHGAGERGNDNEAQLRHGAQMWLNPANRRKYPCWVLFPQCPAGKKWAFDEPVKSYVPSEMPVNESPSEMMKFVRGLVWQYIKEKNVDPDRVYVIGLSMGGMAPFDMVSRFPSMFAAAVPICGAVNPKMLDKFNPKLIREVNFFIYHGDADPTVPVECSRAAYEKLVELKGKVDYTEFVGCEHNSWNPAFNQPDFMEQLFKCRRSHDEQK